jgi:hypothetical protein
MNSLLDLARDLERARSGGIHSLKKTLCSGGITRSDSRNSSLLRGRRKPEVTAEKFTNSVATPARNMAAHGPNQEVFYATPLGDEVKCYQRIPAEF